jgi:chitodextrinase
MNPKSCKFLLNCIQSFLLLLVCSWPCTAQSQAVGVPRLDPDYNVKVTSWWATHRFNPESSSYNPAISSPTPIVDLTSGQSIQTAINSLPSTGGTIRLAAGTYSAFDIVARNNVHVISSGGAVIRGHCVVAVSDRARSYADFDRGLHANDPNYVRDFRNPTKNFYFKNLIFDGGGTLQSGMILKRVYDIVFDGCTFRNFYDPRTSHPGVVNGHMGLNNIWFRGCHFVGNSRWVTYLDGCHGCGMINNTIEGPNFGSGGFLFLTNDDFSEDENGNGTIERREERNAKYIVIYNNTYNGSIYSGLQVSGENILFKNNRFTSSVVRALGVDTKWSDINPSLVYASTDIYVVGNTFGQVVQSLINLFNYGSGAPAGKSPAIMGRYHIWGNRTGPIPQLVTVQQGPIIGPNDECGNCLNNSGCTPNPNCMQSGDTTAPTAPSSLRMTSRSSSSISLAWNASTDNVGVTGYRIFRGGSQVGGVTSLAFTDSDLLPSTTYTYQVRAVDAAGNVSAASSSLEVSTSAASNPGSSSVIARDTFTAANGSGLNGRVSDSGHSWTVGRGNFAIQNNKATHSSAPAYALMSGLGTSRMIIDSTITLPTQTPAWPNDWFHGILAGAEIRNGAIYDGVQARFLWQDGSSEIELWEFAEGRSYLGLQGLGMAFVNLRFHGAQFQPGGTYTLRLILNGRSAMAYIVGQEAQTIVVCRLGRDHLSQTAGLSVDYQGNTGLSQASWDDFTIRTLADTTPPTTPTNLRVIGRTSSTITFGWDGSSDNVKVAGYVINGQNNFLNPHVMGGSTFGTVTALQAGTSHPYTVTAFDADGNVSLKSVAVTAAPSSTSSQSPSFLTTPVIVGQVGVPYEYDSEAYGNPRPTYSLVSAPAGMTIDSLGLIRWNPTSSGTYQVSVRASNGVGTAATQSYNISVAGSSTGDVQAPSIPQNLQITGSTTNTIRLSWGASTDNVGVSGYRVYRNGVRVGSSTDTLHSDTGLQAGTSYLYSIRAYDAAGNVSAESTRVTGTTASSTPTADTEPPTAPSNLRVTGTATNSITLAWNASTDNVKVRRYYVYLGNSTNQFTSTTNLTATIMPLRSATDYTFSVRAKDASGNYSAPSQVIGRTLSAGSVVDSFNNVNGVNLANHISDSGHPWEVLRGAFSIQNGAAVNSTSTAYALIRNLASSSMTIDASITVPTTAPVWPADWFMGVFGAADVRNGAMYDGIQARFLWQDGSSEIELWEWAQGTTYMGIPGLGMKFINIRGELTPGGTYTLRLIINGRDVTAYIVGRESTTTVRMTCARDHLSRTAGLSVDNQVSGTYSGRWNHFMVSPAGTSAPVLDTQAPGIPSNLRTTSVNSSSVSLAWNASTDNIGVTGYQVLRNGVRVATVSSNMHTDQGLAASTSYQYAVRAVDAAGNLSPISAALPVTTSSSGVSNDLSVSFPLGMFEDANLAGTETSYRSMVDDLRARGFDSLMMVNARSTTHGLLLGYTDTIPFNVYLSPAYDLERSWWPDQFPATIEQARIAAKPIVDAWKAHPSLKGYYTKDEPGLHEKTKVQLISQAFRELDPSRPNFPLLIGVDRIGPIFQASQAGRMVIDIYPCGSQNAVGDFTLRGFGYSQFDFVTYIREAMKSKPANIPLWVVLQTHKWGDGGAFYSLREPTATEIRSQNWLALGEGAQGIFWFIYRTQQSWKGLVDNPVLYDEVTRQTNRTRALRPLLATLRKSVDEFQVSGAGPRPHYASTLSNSTSTGKYVVVVNRDCVNPQSLRITSLNSGRLKDLETGIIINQGASVSFPAGDGKMFQLVP